MTIFDLLFAALFLTAVGSLIAASTAALRGRRDRARTILERTGVGAALYFAILILVSALSPQRFIGLGENQCSDDWCIAVQSVRRDTAGSDVQYEVAFLISSRARRVDQRERFVAVYLRDDRGRRYAPPHDATAVPFDTVLAPGQGIVAMRRFDVPRAANVVGLVVTREGAGRFPVCCIIADEGSLFHTRTIVKLD